MIDAVETIIHYRFKDENILKEALTHASCADDRLSSNERMEFLGDAVLGMVVCEYLFQAYPDLQEGEMTKIKSTVVSRKTCALVTESLGLDALLNTGKGMTGRQGIPSSVSAAVLEAMIAAIYLDAGMEKARAFILEHMTSYIEAAAESSHQQNYKSALQQYAQKVLPTNPCYLVLDEKGPDHAKCFEVCVEIQGRRFSSSWANSKKDAEQKAALTALIELGIAQKNEEGVVQFLPEAVNDL